MEIQKVLELSRASLLLASGYLGFFKQRLHNRQIAGHGNFGVGSDAGPEPHRLIDQFLGRGIVSR